MQTREHNRLSVAPRLTLSTSVENETRRIRIRNDGIGPAIIDRMQVRMRTPGGDIQSESWMGIQTEFASFGHTVSSIWQFSPGDAVGVDKQFVLSGVDPSSDPEAAELVDLFQKLGVRIDYSSIYGDPYTVTCNWPEE